jgi:hypothetical protein
MIRNLGVLCLALLVAAALSEVVFRIYLAVAPAPADSPYIADAHASYRLRPTPVEQIKDPSDTINSLGFRDREHARSKAPGTARVLGIGDSFVYSQVALRDNFLRIVEARLDSVYRGVTDIDMYLMGIGGYSPENEVGVLRSLGAELDPDLVILNFYVGNDITGIPVRGELLRGRLVLRRIFLPTAPPSTKIEGFPDGGNRILDADQGQDVETACTVAGRFSREGRHSERPELERRSSQRVAGSSIGKHPSEAAGPDARIPAHRTETIPRLFSADRRKRNDVA